MRKVMVIYSSRADELVKKVNNTFQIAENQSNKIYKTQYVYADMDKYYCFIEYETTCIRNK